jgi:hypothetical protein
MNFMNNYEFHLDIRLDGKYYRRIYQHDIPGTIAITVDYDTEEPVTEAAEETILVLKGLPPVVASEAAMLGAGEGAVWSSRSFLI